MFIAWASFCYGSLSGIQYTVVITYMNEPPRGKTNNLVSE